MKRGVKGKIDFKREKCEWWERRNKRSRNRGWVDVSKCKIWKVKVKLKWEIRIEIWMVNKLGQNVEWKHKNQRWSIKRVGNENEVGWENVLKKRSSREGKKRWDDEEWKGEKQ